MSADEKPAAPWWEAPGITAADRLRWREQQYDLTGPDRLRFAEGDFAILASPRAKHSQPWAGCTVRITYREVVQGDERLLARNIGVPSAVDYVITYPDGSLGGVDDWQLRPETPEETNRRWGINR